MKVKCIDNKGVERFLTKGKIYEVIECHEEHFFMVCDVSSGSEFAKRRFEIVPSIDDVIKDKEKEKKTMNGLEAIELMKQGKIVIRISTQILYRLQDGVLEGCDHAGTWNSNWLFAFNAEYEEHIEPKPLTGWERAKENEEHYYLRHDGEVMEEVEEYDSLDNEFYEAANYFSTREKAEEINFKQMLFRKLQRFSDENGGNEIDWNDRTTCKWSIYYNISTEKVEAFNVVNYREFGQVYFVSKGVANKAIELFKDDLIKYFTGDFGGKGNE